MNEIKLYKSSLHAFYLFLGSIIFTIIGLFMVLKEGSWEGWLVLIFFGFGCLVSIVMFLDRRPQIIINYKGIWRRKAIWIKYDTNKIIEWNTIKGIYARAVESNKFICLIPIQIEEKKQNLFQKKYAKLNREMGFQDLNINLALVNIDEHKLADFLNSMVLANNSQREHLIQNFIIPAPKSFFSKFKF